jgi:hypothetical protein
VSRSGLGPHVRRHRLLYAGATAVVLGLVAFVLVYFQPQKLFIDDTVSEPVPTVAARPTPVHSAGATASSKPAPDRRAEPEIVARGQFHSGEHTTTGEAQVLHLSDGRAFLRLEDLRTSNGPALRVWLTDVDAAADDAAIDRSRHLDLGGLKGNIGDQNYPLPARLGEEYRSVVIWCARFHVSFGAAPLALTG